jgi:DNA-damage-inducible protein D
MISKNIPAIGGPSFEELKQSNEHDAEYWSDHDLQPLLGYSQWRCFEDAIKRATTSCKQSGNNRRITEGRTEALKAA